jgi:MATE family multidrug resistance protein
METYMSIRFLSAAALIGAEGLANWYGGLGNTRIALVTTSFTTGLNIFLNYALIEPRFGLPGYGVAGAAWASTVATTLSFGLLLGCFFLRIGHEIPRGPLVFRWHEMTRMLRFGVPSGLNYFLEFASFALFINVVVGHLGTTTLAAFNIVFQLNMLAFMPAFGLASAGAIMVGDAIGRGEADDVGALTVLSLKFAAGWMVLMGLCYIMAPQPFIALFVEPSQSSELLEIGAFMLAMSGIWQLFDAISITITESLRAAGDTAWPMAARIFLAWALFTPGSWVAVMVFEGGTLAVMLSVIVYIFVLALLLIYRFRSGAWRKISLTGPTEPVLAS